MTHPNILNITLPNCQLNNLISRIKKNSEVTLNLSPNGVRDSNDEISFPHKLLLTDTQVSRLSKFFCIKFIS